MPTAEPVRPDLHTNSEAANKRGSAGMEVQTQACAASYIYILIYTRIYVLLSRLSQEGSRRHACAVYDV